MKTKAVTLDTNVWLSIALAIASGRSSSPALALFRAIRVGRLKAVISDAALYELGDVLSRIAFQLKPTFIIDFLDMVDAICGHVATRGLDMGCRDDADDKIVELAYNSRSEMLITRDNDLAVFPIVETLRKRGCAVCDVTQALRTLGEGL